MNVGDYFWCKATEQVLVFECSEEEVYFRGVEREIYVFDVVVGPVTEPTINEPCPGRYRYYADDYAALDELEPINAMEVLARAANT